MLKLCLQSIFIIYLFTTQLFVIGTANPQNQNQHIDKTDSSTKQAESSKDLKEDKKDSIDQQEQSHDQHTTPSVDTTEQNSNKSHQDHQNMPGMQDHTGMAGNSNTSQMHQGHMMMNSITGGPFRNHLAIGSGTSILPASSPGYMWYFSPGDWTVMMHGELKTGFNYQSGVRGIGKAESQNNFMIMASHKLIGGELMLREMFSAEPLTYPHGGSPQLFQTGETYRGRSIIDAQHPHDLFMELALSYTYPITEQVAIQFYGGPVAEPALGPTAFMHRPSASENPVAPLGHHWQDSTHISHGVFTTAITAWRFKLEGSIFNGREPDENRVAIDLNSLDSYSGRLWFTPNRNWAMQVSLGHLKKPEAHAGEFGNVSRATASISYNRGWNDGNWATSLIWGRNSKIQGDSNVYTLESTVNFLTKDYFYTRIELADREELLQPNIFGRPAREASELFPGLVATNARSEFEPQFRIGAFTFGGVRDLISTSKLLVGIGADITFYHQPQTLKTIYGNNPVGTHFFIRLRPGKMQH